MDFRLKGELHDHFTYKITHIRVLSGTARATVHGQALSKELIEIPNHERLKA